jgi:D-sedoheptulose 7-phosphate isomerase
MENNIAKIIQESIQVKHNLLQSHHQLKAIEDIVDVMVNCFTKKGKVLFCGNGGSAADAQHIAAEFSGRFYKDRAPLFAEALHVNTSYLTAVANDYSFEEIYSRMVEAMGREGDVLVGISTSGNSANVVNALKKAKELGMFTIGWMGEKDGKMNAYCDIAIQVPSSVTPRIQESHILIGHIICELVEAKLFG